MWSIWSLLVVAVVALVEVEVVRGACLRVLLV
jgi:hypothetical protein